MYRPPKKKSRLPGFAILVGLLALLCLVYLAGGRLDRQGRDTSHFSRDDDSRSTEATPSGEPTTPIIAPQSAVLQLELMDHRWEFGKPGSHEHDRLHITLRNPSDKNFAGIVTVVFLKGDHVVRTEDVSVSALPARSTGSYDTTSSEEMREGFEGFKAYVGKFQYDRVTIHWSGRFY